jgi:hypothetical protein
MRVTSTRSYTFFSPEAKNTFKCCGVLYLELEVAETVRAENEFFFPG